jgi:hypothetical protein
MKEKKFKILILSDLKQHTTSTVKSALSLSRIFGADVDLFHVKKPTDVVATDSQLSAMRCLNQEINAAQKNIKELINPLCKTYGVNIASYFEIGNVKAEIGAYIKNTKPDVIVLGKRQPKILKFTGDSITDFILKTYNGSIVVVSDENTLSTEKDFQIGLLNGKYQVFNQSFTENLLSKTSMPLKTFNIVKSVDSNQEAFNKSVDYVFEKNNNTIKNLSNYLEKNQVNLLMVNRADSSDSKRNNKAEIKNVINSVNVPLFITSNTQNLGV